MSNTNNTMQTQTSNVVHNAIMEAGGKDHPPMLAHGNYIQGKSRIKRYIDIKPNQELIHYCLQNPPYKFKWTEKTTPVAEGSSETRTEGFMETYKTVPEDIRKQLDAEAEAIQIILIGIDNDIYSTVDACLNAFYHSQNHPTHYTQNSSTIPPQDANRNRGKAIVNFPPPTYDQEPAMVAEDDEMFKEKGIDKLMALIFLSFKKIYKPTSNNLRTTSNNSRANQDNSPRTNRGTGYDKQGVVTVDKARKTVGNVRNRNEQRMQLITKEKILLCKKEEAGIQLSAEQVDWRDDTNDEPEDQELEAVADAGF
ncbi:hypothetical protein Tco_1054314 [Tanacetum coccineum]|uniref:Uncharacterized protein n=1 Tax=Tanacetum coccineum TaxID=301880 RepID=A0ABQ5GYJ6_9ASTR